MFPPLLAEGDPRVVAVVTRLQQDHLQMESRWRAARPVLQLVAEGKINQLFRDDDASLDAFAVLYAGHIEAEEEIAYPAAQAVIGDAQRTAMGEEMMRRRGVK